jgi:hypothetical protein
MSDSIYHYQSGSLLTFTVSVFTFLTHTANIPILYTAIPQHIISPIHLLDIRCFWNPSQSLLVRCTAKEVTLGFLIIPHGVKSHSLCSCLRCLFTLTPSPCSCEVIHSSMTTMSVFMQWIVISAFISGVHCVLNASKTSIPYFLRSTPGPTFHITNNQSFVSSMVT